MGRNEKGEAGAVSILYVDPVSLATFLFAHDDKLSSRCWLRAQQYTKASPPTFKTRKISFKALTLRSLIKK